MRRRGWCWELGAGEGRAGGGPSVYTVHPPVARTLEGARPPHARRTAGRDATRRAPARGLLTSPSRPKVACGVRAAQRPSPGPLRATGDGAAVSSGP